MNKSILAIVAIVVVGMGTVFAVYPYFTESTVDEAIPAGAITQSMMEDKDAMLIKDDSIMEEESIEIPSISYAGTFIGVGDGIHDAQGDAYTIPLENESTILRLENFESTNGPDLFVYLATDDKASDFVNLGDLKANRGNQNYEIPDGTDLSKYNKVLIWCKAFGVLFGSAELSS
ncbi:MAG: DM13 domain-containing protein [Candidatus Nitrosopumilus sp. bin_7KS]